MDLERDIYGELSEWKKKGTNKVLELDGARQVGKTYILNKFASNEYRKHVYINMIGSSGEKFLLCLKEASEWAPGQEHVGKPLHKAFELYDSEFSDTGDLLVIIDEIQESPAVYSKIREFSREFKCHFIVTGSYLGKTREKEFFLSAGDVETMTMNSLSFPEFLQAVGKRNLYNQVDLYGASDHASYDELRRYFEVYLHIGGYPEVVKEYIQSGDTENCFDIIENLIRIFVRESSRYFENPLEIEIFEKVLSSIAITMLKEKKGTKDLITDLSKIIYKEESGKITKKNTRYAISWLFLSHQIGYCSKSIDCNNHDIVDNCRYYFNDLGIANWFLSLIGDEQEAIDGCLCENFVYLELKERIARREIAGQAPWFGTDEKTDGELDFYVRSRLDFKNYGLEVKRGNEVATTANSLLKRGKLDYVYNLKNTYGGINGVKYAVPLYLAGRIRFDLRKYAEDET